MTDTSRNSRKIAPWTLLIGALATCHQQTGGLTLSVRADPATGRAETLVLRSLADVDGTEVRVEQTSLLIGRDLRVDPFVIHVEVDGVAAGTDVRLSLLALDGDQAVVAAYAGRQPRSAPDVVDVELTALAEECDADGDGYKPCDRKPECCSALEQADFVDCDDANSRAYPFAEMRACRICTPWCKAPGADVEPEVTDDVDVIEVVEPPDAQDRVQRDPGGGAEDVTPVDVADPPDVARDEAAVDVPDACEVDCPDTACACPEGGCPDGAAFLGPGVKCAEDAVTESWCKDGKKCGGALFVHHQDRYCSGTSAACDGAMQWDATKLADACLATEACLPGADACVPDPTCTGFVTLAAETFWRGSPDGELCADLPGYAGGGCPASETATPEPGHCDGFETMQRVTLTTPFEIMNHELTQGEWKAVMGEWNPSTFAACGDQCPVETVSWFDVVTFANAKSVAAGLPPCYVLTDIVCRNDDVVQEALECLNATRGGIKGAFATLNGVKTPYKCLGYRLPTTAEWEFAYRARDYTAIYTSPGNDGTIQAASRAECALESNLDDIAWYCANSSFTTHPTGGPKQPNKFGLYDMAGNVWEWCSDAWEDNWGPVATTDPYMPGWEYSEGTIRGGSYGQPGFFLRAALRSAIARGYSGPSTGARLARSLP